jgi:predicted metal-dependent hydrolase
LLDSPTTETVRPEWQALAIWHLAEEVERRIVTFDAFEAIVG